MPFLPSQAEMATRALLDATQRLDLAAMAQALAQGADPNATIACAGMAGEPIALWAARRGEAQALELLLGRGARPSAAVVLAGCLLVERATRKAVHDDLGRAKAVVETLERHGADWGASERFVAGGTRAIDLLAAAQPGWVPESARQLALAPQAGNVAEDSPAAKSGRVRRS